MGGLLPTWRHFTDPLQMVTRPIQMGPVWMQAGHACGVPIQPNIWRDDPPRSSYPACIAVKCAGFQSAEAEERYLFRLREAVMTKGLNISRIPVLCAIATTVQEELSGAFSVSAFQKALNDESGIEAFRKDLDEVRQRQISRFPALLVRGAGQDPCLLSGYHTFEQLVSAIPLFSPYPTPPSH
jgi:predicted DsbA family dithiol-disulfide isomerase